jgi:hypothetical protein
MKVEAKHRRTQRWKGVGSRVACEEHSRYTSGRKKSMGDRPVLARDLV